MSKDKSITVINLSRQSVPSLIRLENCVKKVLKAEQITTAGIGIVLINKTAIRKLNKKFLAKNMATDVLAFGTYLAADIAVSVDAAKEAAGNLRIPFEEELCRYIVHGILHLCGYDDLTPAEKKKMWKRQEELVKKYCA